MMQVEMMQVEHSTRTIFVSQKILLVHSKDFIVITFVFHSYKFLLVCSHNFLLVRSLEFLLAHSLSHSPYFLSFSMVCGLWKPFLSLLLIKKHLKTTYSPETSLAPLFHRDTLYYRFLYAATLTSSSIPNTDRWSNEMLHNRRLNLGQCQC